MKRILAFAALTLIILPAFAQTAGQQAFGLPLLGQKTSEGITFLRLQDTPKTEILLNAQVDPDAKRMKAITTLAASLRSWQAASITEMRVVNYEDRFQLLALVSKLTVGAENVAPSIPGGMFFVYTASGYEYDFRIKAGGLFVRAKGLYSSYDELVAVVARILKDPAGFVLASDPLYSIKHFGEVEARASQLENRATQLEAAAAQLESKAARLEAEKAELAAQLEAQKAELKAENAALDAKLEAASAALKAASAAELENTRAVLMTLYNGNKPVRPEILAKVREMKAAEPKIDKTQIAAKFKAAGVKDVTAKEIEAILLVYYNER